MNTIIRNYLFKSGIFRTFLILGLCFSLPLKLRAQTADKADYSLTNSEYTEGIYAMVKDPDADVHEQSGITVYTWVESQDPFNNLGQKSYGDIYCQVYDINMKPMAQPFRLIQIS